MIPGPTPNAPPRSYCQGFQETVHAFDFTRTQRKISAPRPQGDRLACVAARKAREAVTALARFGERVPLGYLLHGFTRHLSHPSANVRIRLSASKKAKKT